MTHAAGTSRWPALHGADEVAAAEAAATVGSQVRAEIGRVIVGQAQVVEQMLIAVLARGHCLMQGVPGLAKTLLVSTLASAVELTFSRLQFTPDLMPGDITGSDILQESDDGRRRLEFVRGPIFANIVLADEINRTPPKTQSALLQAMQERHVTAGGRTLALPDPFFVLATQNPIEHEGTYPLPEAQLDRFMFMVLVQYPAREEELRILAQTTAGDESAAKPVLDAADLLAIQRLVRKMPAGEHVLSYALDLVRATRPTEPDASEFVKHWLTWGAGPRAGQNLVLAAKARALLQGRTFASTQDVAAAAAAVLRHRIVPNFNAEAEGITADQIVEKIVTLVPRGK